MLNQVPTRFQLGNLAGLTEVLQLDASVTYNKGDSLYGQSRWCLILKTGATDATGGMYDLAGIFIL